MISPPTAYSSVHRRDKYVLIVLLPFNLVNVTAVQGTSGYELQNFFEYVLAVITFLLLRVLHRSTKNIQRDIPWAG
jgi:hypothetical protein